MTGRLPKDFYRRPATELASELVGKYLCRQIGSQIHRYRITETECYYGTQDTACHAHKGKTPRTKLLYKQGGVAYVYLCYGLHYLLNVVTGPRNHPEAVLIRAVKDVSGPARLTKLLQIDKTFNGENLTTSQRLWLEDGKTLPYSATPRIGITYASKIDQNIKWRYIAR